MHPDSDSPRLATPGPATLDGGTAGHVIRGLNCPSFGNHAIRAKLDAAVDWLDGHGFLNIGARVAIDRSALLMIREEFARLEAPAARPPAAPIRDRPDPASVPLLDLARMLPPGTTIAIEESEFRVTIPR